LDELLDMQPQAEAPKLAIPENERLMKQLNRELQILKERQKQIERGIELLQKYPEIEELLNILGRKNRY
jgi:predicted  nucleic acid-binding Zn-ribbon protein